MSGYEKQLALVEGDLHQGEQIITSLKGVDGSLTGALVVTNQRFVFFGSNGLKKERRAYPWAQITSIEHEINRLSVDHLRVSTPSGTQKYLVSRGDDTAQFVSTALSVLEQTRAGAATATQAAPDVADQLAKLGLLRDAGSATCILSEGLATPEAYGGSIRLTEAEIAELMSGANPGGA